MKKRPAAVFWIATAGMEISAIYAWTDFVLAALTQRSYPLPEAAAIFVASSILVFLVRNWRSIGVLSIHVVASVFLILRNAYVLWYGSEAFWSSAWVADLFSRGRTPAAWATLALLCAWTVVFWISGGAYARRSKSYPAVCDRFDKGLTWLFVLLFVKFIIRVPVGVQLAENISDRMIYPFFLFGLMAVALARSRSEVQKRFLSGYRGIGVVISFSAAVILCGGGLLLLFLPFLRAASQTGYSALKAVGIPLLALLADMILFSFGEMERKRRIIPKDHVDDIRTATEWKPPIGFFTETDTWIIWTLLGLLVTAFVGMAIWYAWRWLRSSKRETERTGIDIARFWRWLKHWIAYLFRFLVALFAAKKRREPVAHYRALLTWGRRSGLPKRRSETPLEYGYRLKQQLGTVTEEIDSIVSSFNLYVYAQTPCDGQALTRARRALRRLRSPFLWPRRAKLLFLSGE